MSVSRRARLGSAMVVAASTAVGLTAPSLVDAQSTTVVRVGVPLDISGSAAVADIGESELAGMELALSEVIEEGVLGDVEIELVVRDTKGDKQEAVAAVLDLVDREQVDAIVGFTLTPSFTAAVPQAVEAGLPVIALGLAAPGVTDAGDKVFRILPDVTNLYAVNDPLFAEYHGATTAAYLYPNDSETTVAIHDARIGALEAAGVETLEVQAFTTTDTDFRAQLTEVAGAGADVIVLTSFPGQFAPIYLQAEELGIDTPIISSDGSNREEVIEQAGPAMECVVFNALWAQQSEIGANSEFVAAMVDTSGGIPDTYSASGYDAMWVYALAVAAAGSADSDAVVSALYDLEGYEGALGVYEFDENREPTLTGVNLQMRDGELVAWSPDVDCTR